MVNIPKDSAYLGGFAASCGSSVSLLLFLALLLKEYQLINRSLYNKCSALFFIEGDYKPSPPPK